MKLRKLLPFLLAVTLIACVPTPAPSANPPTVQRVTDTAAPPTNTSPAPTDTAEPATNTPPAVTDTVTPPLGPTLAPATDTPSAPIVPIGTPTELAAILPADNTASAPTNILGPAWGHQTKFSGCVAQGALPDPACTPGDIFPNVTEDQVCVSGYSSSGRNVPASEKEQVYAEYSIVSHSTGQYEVDHFVSLELGGSNDISNLFPEAADPKPGFHEKDQVENYLHDQVCQHGTRTLAEAQRAIATNWLAVFAEMSGSGGTPGPVSQPTSTQSELVAPTGTGAPGVRATTTQAHPASSGYVCSDGSACIKGNISSDGRKLYHFPGCPSYNTTEIDTSNGERWFVTAAEAEAAGWVKAGNCP